MVIESEEEFASEMKATVREYQTRPLQGGASSFELMFGSRPKFHPHEDLLPLLPSNYNDMVTDIHYLCTNRSRRALKDGNRKPVFPVK